MLKILSLQIIQFLLTIPSGQFLTSSCLYLLFGVQKVFHFLTAVPEKDEYFLPLAAVQNVNYLSRCCLFIGTK